ncbi:MAG: nucleotidyl transferase AbiEii/AbiGii toxin family protein [Patescibacteria group bacterium]
MHPEILSKEQIKLLPVAGLFKNNFGLVGGTAIALYLGHRRSIDFDLFSDKEFDNFKIRKKIEREEKIYTVYKDEQGQYTFLLSGVQFTFFNYPFSIEYKHIFEDYFRLPDLLTLAAMKAYVLGRRAKWKDYVDLYFILRDRHSLIEIAAQAKKIFAGEFNERIFREQLCFFDDVNYTETIDYMPGFEVSDKEIKKALIAQI